MFIENRFDWGRFFTNYLKLHGYLTKYYWFLKYTKTVQPLFALTLIYFRIIIKVLFAIV